MFGNLWKEPISRGTLAMALLLSFGFPQPQQSGPEHPILVAIEKHWIVVPKDQEEKQTKVTILGVTCNAIELRTADIQYEDHPPRFFLEYTKYVDTTPRNNPDTCLDLDVPDIDTTFDLTFSPSGKSNEIAFAGQLRAGCKDCKPKRAKSITGLLRKIGSKRYQLTFSGDLSDTLELEEKE
jgi:hypothetical protein